jgi:hypothetical protein
MDRLLQSVNMVKEVLQSNLHLRQQNLDLNLQVDQLNADVFHLQCENEEFREKYQIMAKFEEEPEGGLSAKKDDGNGICN